MECRCTECGGDLTTDFRCARCEKRYPPETETSAGTCTAGKGRCPLHGDMCPVMFEGLWVSPASGPHDWPKDYRQANGNYLNRCSGCGVLFRGHKRRIVCRKCAELSEEEYASMTDAARKSADAAREEEIREFFRTRTGQEHKA